MSDPSIRRDRLLSLLPRIYAAQPASSTIGLLVDMMAERLTALDDDLTRVLRDHWVDLASGVQADGESALELLGGLLDRPRLDKPDPNASADVARQFIEAYRQRLTVTARTLTAGLGTPRAILSLALADLGAEACPLMRTIPPPENPPDFGWRVDATIAWGVRPSVRRTCPVWAKGVGPLITADCPNYDQRVLDAWITENPLMTDSHREPGLASWRPFAVPSQNLAADRPIAEFTALGDVSYPALRNCATGEITLFADILRDGETLTIWPKPLGSETHPFDAYDSVEHHIWLMSHPDGQAVVTKPGSPGRDASGSIYFISGVQFNNPPEDPPVFAGPPLTGGAQVALETGVRFSVLDNVVRTPLLRPGSESWMLLQLANPGRRFDDSDSKYAGPADQEGTRFADWDASVAESDTRRAGVLFKALREAEQAAAQRPDTEPPKKAVDLALSWFARPPATFRLTVPHTGWVETAEANGAIDLLRADLDLARPAGVRALVDFPRPAWREGLAKGEDWQASLHPSVALPSQEDAGVTDSVALLSLGLPLGEKHVAGEGPLLMGGYYDVTRFDMTALR
jgi:hypothetical protein